QQRPGPDVQQSTTGWDVLVWPLMWAGVWPRVCLLNCYEPRLGSPGTHRRTAPMFGNVIGSSAHRSDEPYATGLGVVSVDTEGYWAYTPEGDVFVSDVRSAVLATDDPPGFTCTSIETCF